MNIVVITQEDRFFLPRNFELLCREPGVTVREIVVLQTRGSLYSMRWKLVQWFGWWSGARMAARLTLRIARDWLNRLSGERLFSDATSLRCVARRHGVHLSYESNANDPALVARLASYDLDCVVSYSAPQVFGEPLLGVARRGCVNLHCSLLPHYRGLLPSFWVLLNDEPTTGATVHQMDATIDSGAILRQATVELRDVTSMFEVLRRTKQIGGDLMLAALRDLRDGRQSPRPNVVEGGSYFSWPTQDDARRFRRKGLSLA